MSRPEAPRWRLWLLGPGQPVVVALAALAVRAAYLSEQSAASPLFRQPLLDEQEAADGARALLSGLGLGPAGEPLFKAPGHGLFLAAVMALTGGAGPAATAAWPVAARLVQHLMGAGVAALGCAAARRLSRAGAPRAAAGAAAGLGLALHGPLVRLEGTLGLDFLVMALQSAMAAGLAAWASGVRVQGSGFRVRGPGFSVHGSGGLRPQPRHAGPGVIWTAAACCRLAWRAACCRASAVGSAVAAAVNPATPTTTADARSASRHAKQGGSKLQQTKGVLVTLGGAGAAAGAAWLVRPTLTLALPALAAWVAWRAWGARRSGRAAAAGGGGLPGAHAAGRRRRRRAQPGHRRRRLAHALAGGL